MCMKKWIWTLLLTGTILSYSNGQAVVAELEEALQQMAADSVFDGQILVAKGGQIGFRGAFGEQEDQPGRPVITDSTSMVVYSVGKSMTALAILLLEQDGHLTTEDPLTRHFPELPYEEVTISDMLTMTSGLPRFLPTVLTRADTNKILTNEGVIELIAEYQPPAGKPGTSFAYNNANYILLGSIIERVSGMAYADFMQTRIFEPLGMTNTYESTPEIVKKLRGKDLSGDEFYQTYGAGSIASNATDLFRYQRAWTTEILLTAEQRERAFTKVTLKDGSISNYAFGWRVSEDETGGRMIHHVGDGKGMRASIQLFPETEEVLIYIHPHTNEYHEAVYQVIYNILNGKDYDIPNRRQRHPINPEIFDQYVGSYTSDFGLVHITAENGKLFLRPDPIPGKEELVPSSDTTFYFAQQNLEWQFYFDNEGTVIGFGIRGDRENMGVRK